MTDPQAKDPKAVKSEMSRRSLLKLGAVAAAGSALSPLVGDISARTPDNNKDRHDKNDGRHDDEDHGRGRSRFVEVSIADLQALLQSGETTSRELVEFYLARIAALDQDEDGPNLRAIMETNRFAFEYAASLDRERRQSGPRGPLHGIPVVLKDNIDTVDMMTTAGSLALVGPHPSTDATVTRRLREAGAIILAKTNLSEWANFRGNRSVSGWSGRGRQCFNPYAIDRSPCGSSSGSAIAASASFAAGAVGTETNGSIVCPSSVCGCAAIKPSVGLTSRAGVIPIAHSQDTVGPICRTVADAAAMLGAMVGVDPRDPATKDSKFFTDYTQFLDPNGLKGKRIGIAREFFGVSEHIDRIIEPVVQVLKDNGATVIDPALFLPGHLAAINSAPSTIVLEYEFKNDLNAYLATRPELSVHSLADLIAFNDAHASEEMPYFLQQLFIDSQAKGPLTDAVYLNALATDLRVSQKEGLDEIFGRLNLDALLAPTRNPAWTVDLINGDRSFGASSSPCALAGYPIITVNAGNSFGVLPVGVSFMGLKWSESTLITIAYAFEQATKARKAPKFLETMSLP